MEVIPPICIESLREKQAVSDAFPPILSRRYPCRLFEYALKIALRRIAQNLSNLRRGLFRGFQQPLCLVHFHRCDIMVDRHTNLFLKSLAEVGAVHAHNAGELLRGNRPVQMEQDIFPGCSYQVRVPHTTLSVRYPTGKILNHPGAETYQPHIVPYQLGPLDVSVAEGEGGGLSNPPRMAARVTRVAVQMMRFFSCRNASAAIVPARPATGR